MSRKVTDNRRPISRRGILIFGTYQEGGHHEKGIIHTANVGWIEAFRKNPLSMTEGHTFIEVFLEDRWYLADPTFRLLYSDYDPDAVFYPHNQLFCRKGRDFWDMGIRNVSDLDAVMKECIKDYREGSYREPNYSKERL